MINTNSSCLSIPNNFFDSRCFEEDFFKAVRKIAEAKLLETKFDYSV